MSEAPERIWAWWDDAYDVGLLNEHGDKRYTPNDAKEYVRADRIEELEAKLAKAVEFVECAINYAKTCGARFPMDEACTTIAELTGGKDE